MGVNAYEEQEEGNISAAILVTARLLLMEAKAEKRRATGLDGRLSTRWPLRLSAFLPSQRQPSTGVNSQVPNINTS